MSDEQIKRPVWYVLRDGEEVMRCWTPGSARQYILDRKEEDRLAGVEVDWKDIEREVILINGVWVPVFQVDKQ